MKQHSIFHRVGLVALSAMLGAGAALADNNPGADGTMVLPGKCLHLSIGTTNFTADCKGEIANVNGGGDVSFMFSIRTGGIISFQGNGRKVTGNKTTARLPLTFVNIGSGVGELLGVDRASGSCTFTDPFAGPATIFCSAQTKQFGPVSARFRTSRAAH